MTREELILEARRLRAEGWTAPAIGHHLGVNESTVRNWYLGGTCSDCGCPITYDSARYVPARRCLPCDISSREVTEHGTRTMYQKGCGCDDCRRANRDSTRELKGRVPPKHGASGYTNYGCRCQACKDGHLVHMRSKDWEHQKAWAKRVRGTEPPAHGTLTAYNKYACRCDTCRAAERAYRRSRKAAA